MKHGKEWGGGVREIMQGLKDFGFYPESNEQTLKGFKPQKDNTRSVF